jgi:beta-glucosidase
VNPELNAADAFVVAWLPGTEGAGVSEVLFRSGDGAVRHDFTGRLSFSWPRQATQAVVNRGDAGYDPLFEYGYGLSYAAGAELEQLSEEIGKLEVGSRTVYFDGGPVAPWRLYLGDEADWRVAADSPVTNTTGSENLILRTVDRRAQEDARAARWSGGGMAAVYLAANDPVDLSREANGEMAIAFDVNLEESPTGAVTMRMQCGMDCSGSVDATERLAALPLGEWITVAVRLRCFEDAGADMTRIDVPFGLATDGTAALRFSDVRLVSAEEGGTACP